jgi:hypothetical protein
VVALAEQYASLMDDEMSPFVGDWHLFSRS